MFPTLPSISRSTTFPSDNPSSPAPAQSPQPETPPSTTYEKSAPRQPGWTSQFVAKAREEVWSGSTTAIEKAGSTTAIEKKEGWLTESVYRDPNFSGFTVEDFATKVLDIDKSKLVDELKALLPEKKGDDNSKLIDEALKLPVNASGAVMMMVTTENGPHLVAAHSQRRGMLIQTNGRCEKGESMQETALREFFEELGNPSREDILSSVLLNEENYRGIKGINEIGDNATTIAKRIINNKDEIYVNVSALYANKKTVSHADLDKEIQTLNKRLAASKDFYQEACLILFGNEKTKPGDLKDPTVRKHASEIIDRFKEKCSEIITSNFEPVLFAQYEANPDDVESVKNALRAIVDLSENDRIELLSPESIKTAMNLRKNNLDEFKKIYFDAGFGLLDEYIGKQSPDDFFNSLSI